MEEPRTRPREDVRLFHMHQVIRHCVPAQEPRQTTHRRGTIQMRPLPEKVRRESCAGETYLQTSSENATRLFDVLEAVPKFQFIEGQCLLLAVHSTTTTAIDVKYIHIKR